MSRSFKTQAARIKRGGALKAIDSKELDPRVSEKLQTLAFGKNPAARYGQQRAMRAKMKVDERRTRRAQERVDALNDSKDL